jgi:hypothetical protein
MRKIESIQVVPSRVLTGAQNVLPPKQPFFAQIWPSPAVTGTEQAVALVHHGFGPAITQK